jgi:hypothetical protein
MIIAINEQLLAFPHDGPQKFDPILNIGCPVNDNFVPSLRNFLYAFAISKKANVANCLCTFMS